MKEIRIHGSNARAYLTEEAIPRGAKPFDGIVEIYWDAKPGDAHADRFGYRTIRVQIPGVFLMSIQHNDTTWDTVCWLPSRGFCDWLHDNFGAYPWRLLSAYRSNPRDPLY